jgi:hypothetical protein
MTDFTDRLQSLRTSATRITGHRDYLQRQVEGTKSELEVLKKDLEVLGLVCGLFIVLTNRQVSDDTKNLKTLLTEGLATVFRDQDLGVDTDLTVKRNKVALFLITVQKQADGHVTRGSSRDSFGTSVATVQSILIRILTIMKRKLTPVLILDEVLNTLNPEYSRYMGEFLNRLCEKLGLDLLAITQNKALFDCAKHKYRVQESSQGAQFVLND